MISSALRLCRPKQSISPIPIGPSVVKGAVVDAKADAPIGDRHGFPIEFHDAISSRISELHAGGRPSAIFRAVPGIVVDTIQRMLVGRPWPHVCHVILEPIRPAPPVANSDPSAAIVLEILVVLVVASKNHVPPAIPVWGPGFAMCAIHLRGPFASHLALKASARYGQAVTNVVGINELFRSTFTSKQPSRLSGAVLFRVRKCSQATKLQARNVGCFFHTHNRITALSTKAGK